MNVNEYDIRALSSEESRRKYELPVLPGEFYQSAWHMYKLKKNIDLIMDRRRSFFAHKALIYAGFLAVMAFCGDRKLVRNMMALAAADAIEEIEFGNRKRIKSNFGVTDYDIRYRQIGLDFWREIYYPCGGAKAFMKMGGIEQINGQLASLRKPILAVVDMMRVMHFVAIHSRSNVTRRPSTIGAVASLLNISVDDPDSPDGGRRTLMNHWSRHKRYAPFLYSMSDVRVEGIEMSLLDWLLSGSFEHHYMDFEEPLIAVIRKAKGIHSLVYKLRADDAAYNELGGLVSDITAETMAEPTFEATTLKAIDLNHRLFLKGDVGLAASPAGEF